MDRNANKIVLVTQKSRLQELLYKYNTKAQAKFHIEHMGADFSDYILEDETYQKALANVKQIADKYAKITVVDREFIPNMLFGKDDIVIAVGRDGLVCNTVKYLSGQKLIGVNPDPARWDGFYAWLYEQKLMLAVNDFFIGPKSHTSARYDLTTRHTLGRVITESQSSSGIIVSTGIGQTGWYKSVMAQAKAACGLFGYDGSGDYEKIGWDEKKLSFVVREPFPSNTTDATVVFGTISEGDPFRVLSKMPENGIIFSDGMEEDAIEFNSGVEVNIGMSEWKGCLVR